MRAMLCVWILPGIKNGTQSWASLHLASLLLNRSCLLSLGVALCSPLGLMAYGIGKRQSGAGSPAHRCSLTIRLIYWSAMPRAILAVSIARAAASAGSTSWWSELAHHHLARQAHLF